MGSRDLLAGDGVHHRSMSRGLACHRWMGGVQGGKRSARGKDPLNIPLEVFVWLGLVRNHEDRMVGIPCT